MNIQNENSSFDFSLNELTLLCEKVKANADSLMIEVNDLQEKVDNFIFTRKKENKTEEEKKEQEQNVNKLIKMEQKLESFVNIKWALMDLIKEWER